MGHVAFVVAPATEGPLHHLLAHREQLFAIKAACLMGVPFAREAFPLDVGQEGAGRALRREVPQACLLYTSPSPRGYESQ